MLNCPDSKTDPNFCTENKQIFRRIARGTSADGVAGASFVEQPTVVLACILVGFGGPLGGLSGM